MLVHYVIQAAKQWHWNKWGRKKSSLRTGFQWFLTAKVTFVGLTKQIRDHFCIVITEQAIRKKTGQPLLILITSLITKFHTFNPSSIMTQNTFSITKIPTDWTILKMLSKKTFFKLILFSLCSTNLFKNATGGRRYLGKQVQSYLLLLLLWDSFLTAHTYSQARTLGFGKNSHEYVRGIELLKK